MTVRKVLKGERQLIEREKEREREREMISTLARSSFSLFFPLNGLAHKGHGPCCTTTYLKHTICSLTNALYPRHTEQLPNTYYWICFEIHFKCISTHNVIVILPMLIYCSLSPPKSYTVYCTYCKIILLV